MSGTPAPAARTGVIEQCIARVGRSVAWLTLFMVVLTFAIVVLRYGFDQGWIWLQESVTWMHAAVFMLAAAWTLQVDGHVRVDIVYRTASPRHRGWVDLVGTLLLLAPFCIFLAWVGWDYVAASWRMGEASREAGGLPAIYLLKSLILLMPLLLLAQGLAAVPRHLAAIRAVDAAA